MSISICWWLQTARSIPVHASSSSSSSSASYSYYSYYPSKPPPPPPPPIPPPINQSCSASCLHDPSSRDASIPRRCSLPSPTPTPATPSRRNSATHPIPGRGPAHVRYFPVGTSVPSNAQAGASQLLNTLPNCFLARPCHAARFARFARYARYFPRPAAAA
eukprot:g66934.t1